MSDETLKSEDHTIEPEIQEPIAVEAEIPAASGEEIPAPLEIPAETPEPVPAPVPAPAPKAPAKLKYAEPKAVTLDDIQALQPEPAGPAVVGNGEVDDVKLEKIVFKNMYARKSLSVHHMQRRLAELGYDEALRDKDGFYGDLTKKALARFQEANKLEGNGMVDASTLTLLFTGDPNVNLVL